MLRFPSWVHSRAVIVHDDNPFANCAVTMKTARPQYEIRTRRKRQRQNGGRFRNAPSFASPRRLLFGVCNDPALLATSRPKVANTPRPPCRLRASATSSFGFHPRLKSGAGSRLCPTRRPQRSTYPPRAERVPKTPSTRNRRPGRPQPPPNQDRQRPCRPAARNPAGIRKSPRPAQRPPPARSQGARAGARKTPAHVDFG